MAEMTREEFLKLRDAAKDSYKNLRPFREQEVEANKALVGTHYGEKGAEAQQPLNQIALAVQTHLQALAARNPQVLVLTPKRRQRPAAVALEHAVNTVLKKIGFESELKNVVLGAIFSLGIMKVGVHSTWHDGDGGMMPDTNVFAEAIGLSDWVHDTGASKVGQCTFMGHKYKMDLKEAQKHPEFHKERRSRLVATGAGEVNFDTSSGESLEELSGGDATTSTDVFLEQVELWDMWVPSLRQVVTYSEDQDGPLKTVEWDGPDEGPYLFLGFHPVLKNVMPLPPVANWIDMNDLTNRSFAKLGQQASDLKTIGLVDMQDAATAKTIMAMKDGEIAAVANPKALTPFKTGGVDAAGLAAAMQFKTLTSYVMGNLESMAGLSSQAGTLGQEQMIQTATTSHLRSMQGAVASFVKKVVSAVAQWMWEDPLASVSYKQQIEGTHIELEMSWPYQEDEWGRQVDVRQGEIADYEFDLEPYSMQDYTPAERLQLARSIWREDILPLVPLGVQPDATAYLKTVSKYSGMLEVADWVPDVALMDQQDMPEQRMPSTTTRNYTRTSQSPGMSQRGAEQQMVQQLMANAGG